MRKKKLKSGLALTMAAALLITLFSTVVSAAEDVPESKAQSSAKKSMQAYVEAMQPGWNLGNTLDSTGSDETSWGNPRITRELIQQIAAQGYKSIRIPVTWDSHIGKAPDYAIEPAYLDRVEEVVNWALEAKLYVMINVHHDSWMWISHMEKNHDEVLARYEAVWTQVAERFKNHSAKLMFEGINEPRFTDGGTTDRAKQYEMLKELLVSFHRIVRDSGGLNATRPLVLPTRESSPAQDDLDELYKTIQTLNDPNLIATVHYYGFWPFSVNVAGYYKFEKDAQQDIVTTFDNVHNTLVAKGIPVILGEYGLLGFDKGTDVIEQGEKLKFFEALTHDVQQKGITHMLWDNGQHFNRLTYKWSDDELFQMMKASWKKRPATAETDLVYLRKGGKIQDAKIPLNLNGNQLTALFADSQKLKKGMDYEVSGQELTLKSGLLDRLTDGGTPGLNAVLSARFSYGPDWRLKVYVYDTPVLSGASGTTGAFAVPAAFNGNLLATMEAVYADGSNAGPQNWTSFKEFGYTFVPDYETGVIKLQPEFWREVNDGEVTLKFHFWSGEIVAYKVVKSGTSVTGTSAK
ncbi:cellulase family glycosylhydrolase [Paenibacillus macerans]|uniref:Cellulase family glycosylhydrolase n=1 Tax=Paenibacillus macerans TaxID=44252 RepID=A0A090Z5E9_PAEMA|nr:cellulase family glycosylhydrolase [Paenibacillus macerans]KFN05887.1 cellulase family protein [Paenibacillus macerans]MCY7560128.1 cellulase family glycosylhydrolase [Paenibacillus macerans]MEC0149690.1 cellulase family glycosylhydrolase [Paenibacillus macerans]MEC0328380.1 cellulase family glycosylhydrolase [Paenibacillus macerans]MUG23187.1 cellulase family glycosylhydrolase [Paenibacillus macerans]